VKQLDSGVCDVSTLVWALESSQDHLGMFSRLLPSLCLAFRTFTTFVEHELGRLPLVCLSVALKNKSHGPIAVHKTHADFGPIGLVLVSWTSANATPRSQQAVPTAASLSQTPCAKSWAEEKEATNNASSSMSGCVDPRQQARRVRVRGRASAALPKAIKRRKCA